MQHINLLMEISPYGPDDYKSSPDDDDRLGPDDEDVTVASTCCENS